MTIDLPLIWAGLIAFAVLAYIVLDGFDLGIGILFPWGRSEESRDQMMNAVAPVWDGNETWLVLGGGGLGLSQEDPPSQRLLKALPLARSCKEYRSRIGLTLGVGGIG